MILLLEGKLYSVKEVAEMFDVSENTIRNLCESGELGSIRIGVQYRISEEEIKKYIKQNKKGE